MKYKYLGTGEHEKVILESNTPKEEWGYGTEIFISYQSERLNPEDMKISGTNPVSADKAHWRFREDGTPYIHICDSPNSVNN